MLKSFIDYISMSYILWKTYANPKSEITYLLSKLKNSFLCRGAYKLRQLIVILINLIYKINFRKQ